LQFAPKRAIILINIVNIVEGARVYQVIK